MSFPEKYTEWRGGVVGEPPPASPMFTGPAQPVAEPSQRVPVERFNVTDVLERIERTLEAMLAAAERSNNTPREGAVSSCEIKFLASGVPQPCIKAYAGSPVPVDAAIEAYGTAFREAEAGQMAKWRDTVESLQP